MPQIGCNYSLALVQLIQENAVPVDWIKLSVWDKFTDHFAAVRPIRPALLHVLPSVGSQSIDYSVTDDINAAIAKCSSPHIAVHLSSTPKDWEGQFTDQEVLNRMTLGITPWMERLTVPVLAENMTYYAGRHSYLRCVSDPGFIRQICARTGAGLLLDIAHARVAACHRGEDIYEYLSDFPLEQVHEIHVSGPIADNSTGVLRDWHGPMQDIDFRILKWTLDRVSSAIVTLEYGGMGAGYEERTDRTILLQQLIQLADLCK